MGKNNTCLHGALFLFILHLSLQYLTSCHTFSHFLRQVNGLSHTKQTLIRRADLLLFCKTLFICSGSKNTGKRRMFIYGLSILAFAAFLNQFIYQFMPDLLAIYAQVCKLCLNFCSVLSELRILFIISDSNKMNIDVANIHHRVPLLFANYFKDTCIA